MVELAITPALNPALPLPLYFVLPLLLGWALDKILGDPEWLPHPVVGFGKLIAWGEHRFNQGKYKTRNGGTLAISIILVVFILSALLLCASWLVSPWLYIFLATLSVFYCLAGTTLIREVRMVFRATDCSLEGGRAQVGRIVGRDTSGLSAQEVRTAALETLSENLSDGVVAPLFWYLLLGVPGMLAYKMINTLDSMIGYKNDRYLLFGRIAARIDDAANYIPARITAFLMIAVCGQWKLFAFIRRYGKQHASPNSGFPEAALAGILNCRFGGSHSYFGKMVYKPYIGDHERDLTTQDMEKAVSVNQRVEVVMLVFMAGVGIILSLF